ncbi:MAG TPA: general secretion pathway protein GspG [Sorangium sp.]|nr:general secretion pathway protein GspG [Sorangium sp.]
MARRRGERTIYFPWELRSSWLRFPWMRSRALLAGLFMVLVLIFFAGRERTRLGVRSTRATLIVVHTAIDAYRADHDGRCPSSLQQLTELGYMTEPARDAWGRSLQLTCPGRRHPDGYDLVSFGPTGDMRGLDRIE